MKSLLLVAVAAMALLGATSASAEHHTPNKGFGFRSLTTDHQETTFQTVHGFPGANNCTTMWFPQFIDHFSFGQPSGAATGEFKYNQRVLIYDKYYRPGGPIFFYAGNEGPITVFADIAGLMWQNAAEFNALIVFAEHRFFGKSQPCGGAASCYRYMSTQQAMADYAVILTNYTKQYASEGVITFGGSYGGMLSGYMRIKYPNLVTGSIASSGPVTMVSSSYSRPSYYKVITDTARKANAMCPSLVHQGLEAAFAMIDQGHLAELSTLLKACDTLPAATAKVLVGEQVQGAFTSYAMGDYPVSLNFIFGTLEHPAPAWPMKVACDLMLENGAASGSADNTTLIKNLVSAMNVVNNVTLNQQCVPYNVNYYESGNWDYMVCAEEMPDSIPYFWSLGASNDMFWDQAPFTKADTDAHCMQKYGITTRWGWMNTTMGGGNVGGATNIVWANGLLDPWHSGGILQNVSSTLKAYHIPEGGHHLDLLFRVPGHDAEGLDFVRSEEMRFVKKWLEDFKQSKKQ